MVSCDDQNVFFLNLEMEFHSTREENYFLLLLEQIEMHFAFWRVIHSTEMEKLKCISPIPRNENFIPLLKS